MLKKALSAHLYDALLLMGASSFLITWIVMEVWGQTAGQTVFLLTLVSLLIGVWKKTQLLEAEEKKRQQEALAPLQ